MFDFPGKKGECARTRFDLRDTFRVLTRIVRKRRSWSPQDFRVFIVIIQVYHPISHMGAVVIGSTRMTVKLLGHMGKKF